MKEQKNISKARKNYYVELVAMLPFIAMLFTGIIMLMYHAGKPYSETVINQNRDFWLQAHIISAVISFLITTIHLFQHINWFEKLFTGKLNNKYWFRNLILLISFTLTALTSVFPWLILGETETSEMLLGIHNKFGLLLIVFFVIHLLSYSKVLINMTKKVFIKN